MYGCRREFSQLPPLSRMGEQMGPHDFINFLRRPCTVEQKKRPHSISTNLPLGIAQEMSEHNRRLDTVLTRYCKSQ